MSKDVFYAVVYKESEPTLCRTFETAQYIAEEHLDCVVEDLNSDLVHIEWLIARKEREASLRYELSGHLNGLAESYQMKKINEIERHLGMLRQELSDVIIEFHELLDNPKAECYITKLVKK
jgi:hypothetical protein